MAMLRTKRLAAPMALTVLAMVAGFLTCGASNPTTAAPVPSDRSAGVVEKSLAAYCAKHDLPRKRIEACKLELIPGRRVFRYRIALKDAAGMESMAERHAVLFVDPRSGSVLVIQLNSFDSMEVASCTKNLLDAMKAAGKTAKSNQQAEAAMEDFNRLSSWVTRLDPPGAKDRFRVSVTGPYRNKKQTYGAGVMWVVFAGADDFGIEVDERGHIIRLLSGHVR